MAFDEAVPLAANQIAADLAAINANWEYIIKPHNIWIAAYEFTPTTTNGCAAIADVELATNDIQIQYLAFDPGTQEHATISLVFPEGWDLGTIKAKFYWMPATGCSEDDVVQWGISGVAVSNDDAIDATLGTAVTVTDAVTAGVEADLHVSAATAVITIGGTPALGDLIHIKVYRDADAAGDTMDAEDAWLLGVMLQLTVDQAVAAW